MSQPGMSQQQHRRLCCHLMRDWPAAAGLVSSPSELLTASAHFDDLVDPLILGQLEVVLLCDGRRDESVTTQLAEQRSRDRRTQVRTFHR
jgi:hypothetical protein